jgi:hypothetical protein
VCWRPSSGQRSDGEPLDLDCRSSAIRSCGEREAHATVSAVKDGVVLAEERVSEDPEFAAEQRVEPLDAQLALDVVGRRLALEHVPAEGVVEWVWSGGCG